MKFNITAGAHSAIAELETDGGTVTGSISIPGLGSADLAGKTADGRTITGEIHFGSKVGKFEAVIDGVTISGQLSDLPFPEDLVVPRAFSGTLIA